MVDLVGTASSGSRLAALKSLRDLLARSIEDCESMRDLASLSGRFQSVLEQIDALDDSQNTGDLIDEIAERRAARRQRAAKGSSRAKSG